MDILICGYGNIGKHIYTELLPTIKNCDAAIHVYDKYKNIQFVSDPLYMDLHRGWTTSKFDYVFICVPTEMKEDGSVNTEEVLDCINKYFDSDTIVIKSAIPVGFTDKIANNNNIVVSPEFWGTTQHSKDPDYIILGGYRDYTDKVANLYSYAKDGYYKYHFTDHKTAELVKYMENCWIATKVTFCNEFAEIAKEFGISYHELRELWLADSRVSPSHTYVYPEEPYFNSHCLNKDVPALIKFCEDQKIDTPLIKKVLEIRNSKKRY